MDSCSSILAPPVELGSDTEESEDRPAGDDYKCSATNIIKTVQVLRNAPAFKKLVWNRVLEGISPETSFSSFSEFSLGSFNEFSYASPGSRKQLNKDRKSRSCNDSLPSPKTERDFTRRKSTDLSSSNYDNFIKIEEKRDVGNAKLIYEAKDSDSKVNKSPSGVADDQKRRLKLALLKKTNTKKVIEPEFRQTAPKSFPRKHLTISDVEDLIEEGFIYENIIDEQKWMDYLADDSINEAIFEDSGNQKTLKACTIGFLLRNLATNNEGVAELEHYIDIVILTHPIFLPSSFLFNQLESLYWTITTPISSREQALERIYTKKELERKHRIFKALSKWSSLPEFHADIDLIDSLDSFVEIISKSKRPIELEWAAHLRENIQKPIPPSPEIRRKMPKMAKSTFLSKRIDFETVSFTDIDINEMIRHLTVVDWKLFKRIHLEEFLKKAWEKPDKETWSPNLVKLIESFNRNARWIASEIMTCSNGKLRVKIVERCIEIMKGLKNLQNFHGMFTFYCALNMASVQKLHRVWEAVNRKHISMVQEIEVFIDAANNYTIYRNYVHTLSPPLIPFEGVFLEELIGLETEPDMVENGMVNFYKMNKLAYVLSPIKKAQMIGYKYKESSYLNDYMRRGFLLSEEELYRRAIQLYKQEISNSVSGR